MKPLVSQLWPQFNADETFARCFAGVLVEQVELLAPAGYVAASFAASEDQWQKEINAPDGLEQAMGENTESTKYFRKLRVMAADTVTLEYGVKGN